MRAEAQDLIEDTEQRQVFLERLDVRAHHSRSLMQLLEQNNKDDARSRETLQAVIDQWAKANQEPDWKRAATLASPAST